MVVRWRARSVLACGVLCAVSVVLLLQGLGRGSEHTLDTPLQVRGRDSLPAVPGASGHGNHSRGSREEEEAEERRAKQQSQRRLLGTMALPPYTHAPHTSFIKLEGVDSVGNDLFLVHGASIQQLKDVCKGLEECEGFNSEGWMKSRLSGKKRSTIDLYLKQVARGNVGGRDLSLPEDQAAGVFRDHMTQYNQMEQQLLIYIYPTEVGRNMPSWQDYKYGVEYLFASLLAKSKFRTMDPNRATLFFLPSRCTAYRKSVTKLEEGVAKAAAVMRDMVAQLKVKFPYWNGSLGADHFYICAHDMGTEVAKLADTALWKNAIGLVNTADYSEEYFVSHKDISIPPHPGRGAIDWADIGQGGATFDPYRRTKLAFMAGNAERGSVRPLIYQYYQADPNFHLVKGFLSDGDYMKALKTSKFCLCARGFKAWSPRVMDALWFGCIPVFLADHYLPPLYGLIPWDNISLSIPEQQVASLKVILESVSSEKIASFQRNILTVYQHLTWHEPPRPYDAFHGILFELWQRRHVRRTLPIPVPGASP